MDYSADWIFSNPLKKKYPMDFFALIRWIISYAHQNRIMNYIQLRAVVYVILFTSHRMCKSNKIKIKIKNKSFLERVNYHHVQNKK